MKEIVVRWFKACRRPIDTVTSFKYLGRVMTVLEENWPVFVGNLWKAWKSWSRFTRILGREGPIPGMSGIFFKAVVQAVLIFGSKTWVMNPHVGT